jgi:hypothetical protein
MNYYEFKEEKKQTKTEYDALKKHLGEILLEHNAKEDNPEEFAYFSRKFEEARKKLGR